MRSTHRKAFRYSGAIGLLAIAFLVAGVYAMFAEKSNLDRLSQLSLQTAADRFDTEFEQDVIRAAESCLRKIESDGAGVSCYLVSSQYVIKNGQTLYPQHYDALGNRLASDIGSLTFFLRHEVRPLAYNTKPYAQTFFMRISQEGQPLTFVAVELDLEKVKERFDIQSRRYFEQSELVITGQAPGGGSSFTLRNLFPFFRIAVPEHKAAWTSVLFTAFGIVLLSGAFLLFISNHVLNQNRSKLRFLSTVSHAFKLPLAVIKLQNEQVLRDSENTPMYNRCAAIGRELDRLTHEVDKVISASQLDHVRPAYSFSVVSLDAIVHQAILAYEPILRSAAINFNIEQLATHCRVLGDEHAISDAVLNLLENAVKYSPIGQGTITLRLYCQQQTIAIEVADQGVGIKAADRKRIFSPFVRIAEKHDIRGFGLGLYSVKMTMDAHKGRVSVESKPGDGSRFTLWFPACQLS